MVYVAELSIKLRGAHDDGLSSAREANFIGVLHLSGVQREAMTDAPPLSFREQATYDPAFTERGGYSLLHRTVFVYDCLMADECLNALLRDGGASSRSVFKKQASFNGYARRPLKGAPWLAGAVQTADASQSCDGVLLERLQPNEVKLIDAFQNENFDRLVEKVTVSNGVGGFEEVEAYVYVCPEDNASALLEEGKAWTYAEFRRHHLAAVVEDVVKPCRARFLAEQQAEEAASKLGAVEIKEL